MLNIKNICRTKIDYLGKIIKSFGPTEKTIFIILSIALIISGLSLLWKFNSHFITEVPAHGDNLGILALLSYNLLTAAKGVFLGSFLQKVHPFLVHKYMFWLSNNSFSFIK